MFETLLSLDYRRRRLAAKTPDGPLKEYLSKPFVGGKEDCREVEFVAIDLETTGLDHKKEEIISVGLVLMRGLRIDLTTASHQLVLPTRDIPEESAVIHQITDDAAATGRPLEEVLTELLPLFAGRVMIAHHANIECSFISEACEKLYGGKFLIPVVDTQWIEQRSLAQRNLAIQPGQLRLASLREQYNLPRYRAHDALSDALGAAELFAAQLAMRDNGQKMPLKDYLLKI